MRVLLTGIAGFIGSHVVEHLQANTSWDIVGLASFRHLGDSLRADSFGGRVELHLADLAAPLSPRLIDRIGPVDFIINAAAESHVDRSISDPRHFVENNVGLQLTMLDYARVVKPRAFIQVSTDEVYGPAPSGVAFPEWADQLPSNPYSASKSAQEAISIAYWRTYGVPLVITNTVNNFGERQDPEKMLPLVISRVAHGETVPIHGSPDDVGSRFYLHARNHADAILWLLQNHYPSAYGKVDRPDRFNVTSDDEINNLDLAKLVADIMGYRLSWAWSDWQATRPGHDLRYALDGAKLKGMGWKPPVPLEEGLRRTITWTLQHPEWMK